MKKNILKLLICLLLAGLSYLAIKLPYINIISIFFDGIVSFTFAISCLILFKPKKEMILAAGLALLGSNFIFIIAGQRYLSEQVSVLGYFMVVLYIVRLLIVLKNNK